MVSTKLSADREIFLGECQTFLTLERNIQYMEEKL